MQSKQNPKEKILGSRKTVLAILFFVTGFLGLPLLWLSPAFSNLEKWVWSFINIVYTSALIAGTVAICWWSYKRIFGMI
jgi:hypothetical protein